MLGTTYACYIIYIYIYYTTAVTWSGVTELNAATETVV